MALTIVQRALRVARSAIESVDGRLVSIARAGETTISGVTATIGETRSEDFVDDGVVVTVRSRDFLIAVASYDFGAGPVDPAVGDKITLAGEVWEVLPLSGESHFRRSDRDSQVWRIHTKKIGEV